MKNKDGVTIVMPLPKWIVKAKRNRKARERYFIKRYGSLDRLNAIEAKLQNFMDTWSMDDEMANCEG